MSAGLLGHLVLAFLSQSVGQLSEPLLRHVFGHPSADWQHVVEVLLGYLRQLEALAEAQVGPLPHTTVPERFLESSFSGVPRSRCIHPTERHDIPLLRIISSAMHRYLFTPCPVPPVELGGPLIEQQPVPNVFGGFVKHGWFEHQSKGRGSRRLSGILSLVGYYCASCFDPLPPETTFLFEPVPSQPICIRPCTSQTLREKSPSFNPGLQTFSA